MLSRCVRGPDRRTVYDSRTGRAVQRGVPPLEVVLCRVPETTNHCPRGGAMAGRHLRGRAR